MRTRPIAPRLKVTSESAESCDPQTYAIIGAAMLVHRELGAGFLEAVYSEALRIALTSRGVPFKSEVDLPIRFQGRTLSQGYRADLVCYEAIIVELKALADMGGVEEAQVVNYLKASGLSRGLLFNFGRTSLQYRRFILTRKPDQSAESE